MFSGRVISFSTGLIVRLTSVSARTTSTKLLVFSTTSAGVNLARSQNTTPLTIRLRGRDFIGTGNVAYGSESFNLGVSVEVC